MKVSSRVTGSSVILRPQIIFPATKLCCQHDPSVKYINTHPHSIGVTPVSMVSKILKKFTGGFKRQKLRTASYFLYETVADHVDYDSFIKELKMPDTFYSWFLLTELHVWMLMARLMADHENGRYMRNSLVEAMWQDVTARSKKLGTEHASVVRTQIQELSEEFQAALVSYDEGLLSDDPVLAGAIWRRLLNRGDFNTTHLAALVHYVRMTVHYLDRMSFDDMVAKRAFKWVPFEEVVAKERSDKS